MLRKPALSLVLAATLLLGLAAPSAAAPGAVQRELGGLWGRVWEWLASLPGLDGERASSGREGPAIDPDGRLKALSGQEGPFIDPDGKPATSSTSSVPSHG
jgi:hypothetical protein